MQDQSTKEQDYSNEFSTLHLELMHKIPKLTSLKSQNTLIQDYYLLVLTNIQLKLSLIQQNQCHPDEVESL